MAEVTVLMHASDVLAGDECSELLLDVRQMLTV
jgi:hypothetical protein